MPRLHWTPVTLASVAIEDTFWTPLLQRNRARTIPFQYAQLRDTGRLDALRLDWTPGQLPVPHIFWESDVAKWLEAASYSLATHPDPALDALVDEVIALVSSAQQPDGYLNVYFTVVKPGMRWTDLRDAHELYCAGHLIEAGVAHFAATAKRTLLDVVCRYADHIATVFGTAPGQKRGYCGHEEIELALVKLYRATGEVRYLDLARYFIDERGRQPFYFDLEAAERGTPGYFDHHLARGRLRPARDYHQAHMPVREQTEAVGHAVRAMYLYSAMADLAGETGDDALLAACTRLWEHLTSRRMYVTGGIGSAAENEGFTFDYDLPNESAYAETCAAIGLVFWAHRMAQLTLDGRYVDVLERALYNGVISGISHDGTLYFYDNPLASRGNVSRKEWFDVACCPPNLARLLASLGQYIYSHGEDGIAVHLYIQGTATLRIGDQEVRLRQETGYPWDGAVRIHVESEGPVACALHLRVPGWCREARVRVNGERFETEGRVERGYLRIERLWQRGDVVELRLEMPVERVYAHPAVRQDAGRVALQRGPLVYCLEEADNTAPPHRIALPRTGSLVAQLEADLLGGIATIGGPAVIEAAADGAPLYGDDPPALQPGRITAVPYYAWANRQQGQMAVWIRDVAEGVDG